jgi:DNA-binding transcriptional MerR regulator
MNELVLVEGPMADGEYSIDELSAVTRVPSRTIRFYQSKGALPKPEIRGRVAVYSDDHVNRLGLIAKLQDQGLRIKAIRDLLARVDRGELDLSEWLGLKAQLQTPWADDRPILVSETELYELIGDRREGLIGELLRLKLVQKDRDTYSVRSPALLQVSMRLKKAGFNLEMSVKSAQTMRKHIKRAASEVSEHFLLHIKEVFETEKKEVDLGQAFQALRPLGLEAVQLIFAQEVEKVLESHIASGRTTLVASRKKKKKS